MKPHRRLAAALAAGYGIVLYQAGLLAGPTLPALDAALDGGRRFRVLEYVIMQAVALGGPMLVVMTALAVLTGVERLVARARLRAEGKDPRARLRGWIAAHPWAAAAWITAPIFLAAEALLGSTWGWGWGSPLAIALRAGLGALLPAVGGAALAREVGRTASAPLLDAADAPPADADGLLFSAVAVTPEARAGVAALAVATLVAVAALLSVKNDVLEAYGMPALAAYLALAAGGAAIYRRASRIAVGLDGIHIRGTSRARLFAYRDLDKVDVTPRGEIVLSRGGRAALRLQLHGPDASRRDLIVARLRDAVERAHAPGSGAAARLSDAASSALVAQAARGDGDYRAPGVTRDELWEVVEAPATAPAARARAAGALAEGSTREERARLRIAAEHCADPDARATLMRFAGPEAEAEREALAEREAAAQPLRAQR